MKTLFMMLDECNEFNQASLGGIWERDRCAKMITATDGIRANKRKFIGNDRTVVGPTKSNHGEVGLSLWKMTWGNGQP